MNIVIAALHQIFPTIPSSAISCWNGLQFEYYDPNIFTERADEALAILDKQCSRQAKKKLLDEVLKWLNEDESRARTVLRESAGEVIEDLVFIARVLIGLG